MKRKYDPMDTIRMSAGISIGNMMVSELNNETGNHVDTGPTMNMLGTLPTIHAAGGVLSELDNLGKSNRRRHRL